MNLEDTNLSIVANNGHLTVWDRTDWYPDTVTELPLSKLDPLYKEWQHTVRLVSEEKLGTCLLNNGHMRERLLGILHKFGFKKPENFTISQIEALLFYYEKDGKYDSALLWQLHDTFPRTLDLPTKEDSNPIEAEDIAPKLDIFETAQLYLMQKNQLEMAESMPLSKIMKLVLTDAFIQWVNSPENKKNLSNQQFKKHLEDNPVTKEDLMELMSK